MCTLGVSSLSLVGVGTAIIYEAKLARLNSHLSFRPALFHLRRYRNRVVPKGSHDTSATDRIATVCLLSSCVALRLFVSQVVDERATHATLSLEPTCSLSRNALHLSRLCFSPRLNPIRWILMLFSLRSVEPRSVPVWRPLSVKTRSGRFTTSQTPI